MEWEKKRPTPSTRTTRHQASKHGTKNQNSTKPTPARHQASTKTAPSYHQNNTLTAPMEGFDGGERARSRLGGERGLMEERLVV